MLKFDDDQNIITVKMKVNDSILAMKGLYILYSNERYKHA